LLHLHHQHRQTAGALHTTEHEFQQMADNIQEIFWMLDARTKKTIYVNQAYETITGRSCQSLQEDPSSYEEAIHPEDRPQVLGKLQQASQSGEFDERFRIVRPNGEVRWVAVRGFPVRDSEGSISRLVGTVQEITGQWFAPAQGGTFAPGATAALVSRMAEWGAAGVGQSSWGPAVYGIVDGKVAADALAAAAIERVPLHSAVVYAIGTPTHCFDT